MTEKGVTIERSPSGLGMGVFTPHLGGGGGPAWEQQQNAIITKLTPTPSSRINLNTDNFEKDRRNRKSDEKVDEKNNAVSRSCGRESVCVCVPTNLNYLRRDFAIISIYVCSYTVGCNAC